MNKDEINRYIHVEIMGKCWHSLVLGNDDVWRCNEIDCKLEVRNYGGIHGEPKGNPDYCSDDSPRRLLNEVVAIILATIGDGAYDDAMEGGLKPIILAEHADIITREDADIVASEIVVAAINPTAEQIATACVLAHKAAIQAMEASDG